MWPPNPSRSILIVDYLTDGDADVLAVLSGMGLRGLAPASTRQRSAIPLCLCGADVTHQQPHVRSVSAQAVRDWATISRKVATVIGIVWLGLLATMVCLALQVVASVLAVRYFARVAKRPPGPTPRWAIFLEFSILMLTLVMLGNIVQAAFWALIYMALGAFQDFETALYFLGPNVHVAGLWEELSAHRPRAVDRAAAGRQWSHDVRDHYGPLHRCFSACRQKVDRGVSG